MLSPCIRNCTLNEEDVCVGCGRLLTEITAWASYTDEEREVTLVSCKKRKDALLEKAFWLENNISTANKKE